MPKTSLRYCLFIANARRCDRHSIARANLLLSSMSCHACTALEVCIVTPRACLTEMQENFRLFDNINYIWITDHELAPGIEEYAANPWFKQQVLKLAVSRRIGSDFYMTLDSDLVCVNDLDHANFIWNGRSLLDYELAYTHLDWFKASAALLEMPAPKPSDAVIGVTPMILASEPASMLLDWLEQKYEAKFCEFLLRESPKYWTEYTLYYLFLLKMGLFSKYHVDFSEYPQGVTHAPFSVWNIDQWEKLASTGIEEFKKKRGCFLVIQSAADIPIGEIYTKFRYLLQD